MGRYFLFFPAQKNGQNHCPSNFHDRGKEYERYPSIKSKFDHQFFVVVLDLYELWTWNCVASSANQNKNSLNFGLVK